MYYQARYYDPAVGTFISPDTLVPDATNVLDYNRFMYVRGNPINANDPSGHEPALTPGVGGTRKFDVVAYILEVEMVRNIYSPEAKNIQSNTGSSAAYYSLPGVFLPFTAPIATGYRGMAYVEWAMQVGPSADWDHKPPILNLFGTEQTVDRQIYTFDTWSNIHYGYVGKAVGFTDDELLYGAGFAQFLDEARKGFSNDDYVKYLQSGNAMHTYLDNGNDPAFIQFGILLWDKYGNSLTMDIFKEELSKSGLSVGSE